MLVCRAMTIGKGREDREREGRVGEGRKVRWEGRLADMESIECERNREKEARRLGEWKI